jgi:hypothetical protein
LEKVVWRRGEIEEEKRSREEKRREEPKSAGAPNKKRARVRGGAVTRVDRTFSYR